MPITVIYIVAAMLFLGADPLPERNLLDQLLPIVLLEDEF
jgi:hypothetical protein